MVSLWPLQHPQSCPLLHLERPGHLSLASAWVPWLMAPAEQVSSSLKSLAKLAVGEWRGNSGKTLRLHTWGHHKR